MQYLPVDETFVDMRDFVGPLLVLNCMQCLPVDETIVDMRDFAGPDIWVLTVCNTYQLTKLLWTKCLNTE